VSGRRRVSLCRVRYGRALRLALLAGFATGCGGEPAERVTDEGFLPGAEGARLHYRILGDRGDTIGSIVAASYAEAHPERVRRMVFHGAVGPDRTEAARVARGEGAEEETPSEGDARVEDRLSEAERAALAARADTLLGSLLRGTAADPVAACREWEEIGLRLARARGEPPTWNGSTCEAPPDAVRYYYRHTAQFAPRTFGDWDFTDTLGHVDAPLLVIAGEEDAAALPGQRAWAAALPNGELLRVPASGKGAITHRPDAVIRAVRDFFRRTGPDPNTY